MLEAGKKNNQHHDDASKEVTAPAGVAIICITQGFRPDLSSIPNAIGHAEGAASHP
jgi:hypothetical protein